MTSDFLSLHSRVEVNSRTREVKAMGKAYAEIYVNDLGTRIYDQARINVSPGFGPGPHPHLIPHEDTGELKRSVAMRFRHAGFLETVEVFTDSAVGLFLELGYHAHWGGREIMYPWLTPAYLSVLDSSSTYLRATARLWFTEKVQDRIKRSGMTQMMSQKATKPLRFRFGGL